MRLTSHISICFAAHTLLLMELDAMKELPDHMTHEIDVRTHELRCVIILLSYYIVFIPRNRSEQRRGCAAPQQE